MIKDFLKETTDIMVTPYGNFQMVRPRIVCQDGFSMSVQAGPSAYCEPRVCLEAGDYLEVEIGFPSEEEPLINNYAEGAAEYTKTVYGYVPIELVDEVITKHGGILRKEY